MVILNLACNSKKVWAPTLLLVLKMLRNSIYGAVRLTCIGIMGVWPGHSFCQPAHFFLVFHVLFLYWYQHHVLDDDECNIVECLCRVVTRLSLVIGNASRYAKLVLSLSAKEKKQAATQSWFRWQAVIAVWWNPNDIDEENNTLPVTLVVPPAVNAHAASMFLKKTTVFFS